MKKEWSPQLLSVLRIVQAFLFIQFGTAKWFAFPAAIMPGGGTVPVGSLLWFAAVIEVVGGTLFLLGLFTRPVAFVLSGEMAVAYFHGHASHGPWLWPVLNLGWGYLAGHPLHLGPASLVRTKPGREPAARPADPGEEKDRQPLAEGRSPPAPGAGRPGRRRRLDRPRHAPTAHGRRLGRAPPTRRGRARGRARTRS